MKNFCCLVILFFLAAKCFAQDSFVRILQVDRLPANGVLLDKGWKFHPGDNPDWARPDYNDRGWEDIDPTNDLYYLSELKKYPIGWFRIRFKVDTSLLNKPLSCKIYQSIASEIYLNGELLAAYGSIDVQSNKVNAYRTDYNPVGIIFHKTEQVLAVKFGVEMGLPLTATTHPYYAFRFRILDAKLSPEFKEIGGKYPLLNTLWAGIFLTLALIHLGIFFKFRNRKADLFFSIAMISEAIAHLFYILLEKGGQSLKFITYGFVADWI